MSSKPDTTFPDLFEAVRTAAKMGEERITLRKHEHENGAYGKILTYCERVYETGINIESLHRLRGDLGRKLGWDLDQLNGMTLCEIAGKLVTEEEGRKRIESSPKQPNERPNEAEAAKLEQGEKETETSEAWIFAPSGNGYYIAGFGESGFIKGFKGFGIIARLLRSAGRPVPMPELTDTHADTRRTADRHSKQPSLDKQALEKYRERMRELAADLDNAKDENNTVAADIAQRELDHLKESVVAAVGKSGKARDLNDPLNRLRPAICANLKRAYEALRKANPPMKQLADHFEFGISSESGEFVYRPPTPIPWQFELGSAET